jgi:hypothetical protein
VIAKSSLATMVVLPIHQLFCSQNMNQTFEFVIKSLAQNKTILQRLNQKAVKAFNMA